MSKVNDFLLQFGSDKFMHFMAGSAGFAITESWIVLSILAFGKELYDYIKPNLYSLLSAPSYDNSSRLGKRLWVKKNTPGTKLILAAAKNKQDYSEENAILIDDRADTIEQWNAKGGIGILHTSTANTIQQLKKLGL